jgi:hypothetical protein
MREIDQPHPADHRVEGTRLHGDRHRDRRPGLRPRGAAAAFADGASIGFLADQGHISGAWGVLHVLKPGPNTITVRAIDAAGNRSAASVGVVVNGFYTPGCTPGHL